MSTNLSKTEVESHDTLILARLHRYYTLFLVGVMDRETKKKIENSPLYYIARFANLFNSCNL